MTKPVAGLTTATTKCPLCWLDGDGERPLLTPSELWEHLKAKHEYAPVSVCGTVAYVLANRHRLGPGLSMVNLAQEAGVSRQRVSQILRRSAI